MHFDQLQEYLSYSRMERYLIATGNNPSIAIELYRTNLKIAQSFHPIIGILEVILRNRIHTILSNYFEDSDWIINQKKEFMSHPSLTYFDPRTGRKRINDYLKNAIENSEKRLIRMKIPLSNGKIIADQNFGFWTDLFELSHYKILRGRPIQAFNHLPSGVGRTEIRERLNKIRKFRNRIHHNEPICFKGNALNLNATEEVYLAIIELLQWIDPDLLPWITNLDTVKQKISIAKELLVLKGKAGDPSFTIRTKLKADE